MSGKKSFILYLDQQELFESLPDDIAGKLIKHIFNYVNGGDDETDDLILKIAFSSIKQSLKRDSEKWETQRKQRSDAGKKSAEKRSNEKQRALTSVESRSTKSTVSVSDSVSVSVSVKTETELSAIKIADYLASKIKNANPQTRPKPDGWVKDIEKSIRIDGRLESELISIIDWMYQGDQFWSGVVLSGKKLREKYDTMIVQKNNKGAQNETNRGNSQLTGAAAQKAAVLERIKNM